MSEKEPQAFHSSETDEQSTQDETIEDDVRLKKMAKMRLRPTRLLGPPGASLYDPKWIFIILAAHDGLLVLENYGPEDDVRWINLFGAGMPQDLRRIDMVFSAGAYHEKYQDFIIHIRGIEIDEQNPERGVGAWLFAMTDTASGEAIKLHIWFVDIFLRNSDAHLIAHYTDPETVDPRYKQITKRTGGVGIELMGHNPSDKESSIRLIQNDVLLADMQQIINAAQGKHGGSQARVQLSKDQIKKYYAAFSTANATLGKQLESRRYRFISKYLPPDRLDILKSAFSDAPAEIVEKLANYTTRNEIALQYAMYQVAMVPIGTWKKDRLLDYLNESKELSGIKK